MFAFDSSRKAISQLGDFLSTRENLLDISEHKQTKTIRFNTPENLVCRVVLNERHNIAEVFEYNHTGKPVSYSTFSNIDSERRVNSLLSFLQFA